MIIRLLVVFLLVPACTSFAQGKVLFGNDSDHLYVLGFDPFPEDIPVLGQPIAGTLPSGFTLVAGLYAGTSSSSMTLQSGTTLLAGTGLPVPGRQANRPVILNIPGGFPQWFRIVIWNSANPPPDQGGGVNLFIGVSPLFQATPGTSLSYPSIMPGGPAGSTLPLGNISVSCLCPEPSVGTLLLLGGLTVSVLRRRCWKPKTR